jgi:hypothetical protein
MIAFGGTTPIVTLVSGMGPPWPREKAFIALSSIILSWFMLIRGYINHDSSSPALLAKRINVFAVIGIISICGYVIMRSFFVLEVDIVRTDPDSQRQIILKREIVRGLVYQREIGLLLEDRTITEWKALDGAQYDNLAIWEPWSVMLVQAMMLIVWFSIFVMLSTATAYFILHQRTLFDAHNSSEDDETSPP